MNGIQNDPIPWVHTSGVRAGHPHADGAPAGGYTFSPREGFADFEDRFVPLGRFRP